MSEKKCKYCAMMIPSEAKICPHCRKSQPSKLTPWLVLVIFLSFGYVASQPSPQPAAASLQSSQEEQLTTQGKKVKAEHQAWPNDICNTVAEKKIKIGMTVEQVRYAWGRPYKINTTTGSFGTHEQWVMSNNINSSYVYFENGLMTSLQQSE